MICSDVFFLATDTRKRAHSYQSRIQNNFSLLLRFSRVSFRFRFLEKDMEMPVNVNIPIYYHMKSESCQFPAVDLELYGQPTMFVINTSYSSSVVTEYQAKKWGVMDKIVPNPEDEDILGTLDIDIEDSCFYLDVDVEKARWNILGCDFLRFNCCRLDLDPQFPTLTIRGPCDEDVMSTAPTRPAIIAGTEIDVLLDTSQDIFATCSREQAKDMPLEMPEDFFLWEDFDDVLVSSCGRKAQGMLCVDVGDEAYLGLKFLRGAIFEFEHDGTDKVSFPKAKENDIE